MSNNIKILVLGGTGHYGRHIVKALLENNQSVRVLSRNKLKAREILGEIPEIMEGDITSKEAVITSLEGINAIIISVSAFNKKIIRKAKLIERDSVLMVLEEAGKRGINRIVYISVYAKPAADVDAYSVRFPCYYWADYAISQVVKGYGSSYQNIVIDCDPGSEIF
ncbi:MAG: NAD(P)H-binding protein, partial [Candidatus Hodarchaeota archaeon]